jgi:hypothetical protein
MRLHRALKIGPELRDPSTTPGVTGSIQPIDRLFTRPNR